MNTKIFSGFLREGSYGEADDILFLSTMEEPLCEVLDEEISEKMVTVRYYITESECTFDEAAELFYKTLYGIAETDFGARYSDITGFLWCDEDLVIGGHDLMDELHSYVGKYLVLLVDIHPIE